MRNFLIAVVIPFLSMPAATGGDLGLYDNYLTGVRAKNERYNQTEFDNLGDKFIFTPERLEIVVGEDHRKLMQEEKRNYFANIDFKSALEKAYITPDQVISYDYHVQYGTGIPFKIFYKARNGHKTLASVTFRDENTAKSFHNTFLLWLNGNLSAGEQMQKTLSQAKD